MMDKGHVGQKGETIFLVPHTHYDAIWVLTKEDYFYINIDLILRSVIRLLDKQRDYKFTIEQTYLLEEVERRYPDLFSKIAKYVEDGRIEIADGEYLMADTMLPAGETLVREILLGKSYVKEKFGVDVPVMWQADSFGLNAQLPQIYRKSGYKYVAFRRGCPFRKPSDFIWEGLDGTRIPSHFMPLGYRAGMDLSKLDEGYKELRLLSSIPPILMPSGSGVTLPQKTTVKAVKEWNKKHDVGMKIATPSEYFEEAKKHAKGLPVRRGEMYCGRYSEVFPDVASSRIWLKKSLREYETKLGSFEKFATINFLLGTHYPEELSDCWKKVCFLAFHDVAPGTGMDSGYDEAKEHIGFLGTQLEYLIPRTLSSLVENDADGGARGDVVVFNPLSWDVTNWVEVDLNFDRGQISAIECLKSGSGEQDVDLLKHSKYEDGSFRDALLGFVAHVPATGYRAYTISGKKSKRKKVRPLRISANSISNKFFKLHFDVATGIVDVIQDSKRMCSGNELVVEEEIGDLYYHKETLGVPVKTERGDGVKYGSFRMENFRIDESPLRVVINIETDYYSLRWPYRMSDRLEPLVWRHKYIEFEKQIIIYRDIPRIDFITKVDDKHPRIRLRVKFDTELEKETYTCESQFGAVSRKTDEYYLKPAGWLEPPCGIFPSLNWVDYSDENRGLTLINKGNPENEVRDGSLYMTLLRAVDMLSSDGMSGPAIPVLDAREFGKYTFHYSVYPHGGDWTKAKSYKIGHEFNNGLMAIQLSTGQQCRSERSFLKATPDNIAVTAVKRSERNKDIIVRLYEARGKTTLTTLTLFKKPRDVRVVNLLESADKDIDKEVRVQGEKVKLTVGPFEIVTLRIKF
jgi:alpha-mannosidase